MNDAGGVRVSQRIRHFPKNSDGFRNGQGSPTAKPAAERLAINEWHHVERQAIGGAGIKERQNVRVPKMRGRPNLGDEAVSAYDRRQIAVQHFDGDIALVLDVVRKINGRHSPNAELSLETVSGQKSRRERCGDVRHAAILPKREAGSNLITRGIPAATNSTWVAGPKPRRFLVGLRSRATLGARRSNASVRPPNEWSSGTPE